MMRRSTGTFFAVTIAAIVVMACLLYLAVATTGTGAADWQLQVASPVGYLSVGSDNVLYAFSANGITAIGPDGRVRWTADLPDNMSMADEIGLAINPVYAEDRWNLYVCAANYTPAADEKNLTYTGLVRRDVLAYSPSGRLLWDYPMPDPVDQWSYYHLVRAVNGRVYVYHNDVETVLDTAGNVLYEITGIYGPPAIDEAGNIYAVPADDNSDGGWRFDNYSGWTIDLTHSRTIEAYGPDGRLLWSREIGDYIHRLQQMSSNYMPTDLPLYGNGTICLLAGHRFVALDTGGNILWSRDFGGDDIRLNPYMPYDADGNIYVEAGNGSANSYPVTFALDVRGRSITEVNIPSSVNSYAYLGHVHLNNILANGVCYQINTTDVVRIQPLGWPDRSEYYRPGWKELEDVNEIGVTATDIRTGKALWTFQVPTGNATTCIVNESNVGLIFVSRALEDLRARSQNISQWGYTMYADRNSTPINSISTVDIYPGNNVTYVAVNDVNFEPVVFNQSRCRYINGIYALDETGQVLWFRPADARIEQFAAGNGTIYYTTGGGKIFSGSNGVVSGVAILATVYVFLRFLIIGAVSRARSRLDNNENRNHVYRYVADNPGPTLYDISRDLGMNVGTARYHLMILGINHRIVTHKAFGKYARYFANSGAHGTDEQLLYSALRRQGIRSILDLLVERPGLSNREIAGQLNIQESAASRYMKELTSIGLVERRSKAEGRHAYYINEQYEEALASTLKSSAGKML